jgi:hypothetical protein
MVALPGLAPETAAGPFVKCRGSRRGINRAEANRVAGLAGGLCEAA